MAPISSNDLFDKLHEAGVIKEHPDKVSRVVLDLQAGQPAIAYVRLFVDTQELLDVMLEGGLRVDASDRLARRVSSE